MKPIVKQKQPTLQSIIDAAQTGGGGTVDAYTKAEADAKFETQEAAAATYLSQADAATNYQPKGSYVEDEGTYFPLNGIRVYIASEAPTGTIPEGSIGIGF